MSEFDTLDGTLESVWQRLGRGVADRRSAARHPTLATIGDAGAEARVVVLRAADRDRQTLTVHTDTLSSKVTELRAHPRATLLIWDAKASLQIRLRVKVEVHVGDAEAWAKVPEQARLVYGGSHPPGSLISDPGLFVPHPALDRFAVLVCRIVEIETLHLGTPHRRAKFRDGTAEWIAP